MKILIIGSGPLPLEERGVVNAGGLRTEQFFISTRKDNDVSLIVFENEIFQGIKQISKSHIAVSKANPELKKIIKKQIAAWKPEVVVGVNSWPSFVASQVVDRSTPFWADLNGWMLAELQVQSYAMANNLLVAHGVRMERAIIDRADKISTVSNRQKYAVLGELGMLGRLDRDNFRHSFAEVIENTCRPLTAAEQPKKHATFRGHLFPEQATALLWVGGFNAWADEKTLYNALKITLTDNKDMHFVCSGEVLPGIDESTMPRFRARIDRSDFADRCHFPGWVAAKQISQLYHECDIGLNVDLPCTETETGARNRLNEMMRFNMPIVTTAGAEIAETLRAHQAAAVCDPQDAEQIAAAITSLTNNYQEREKLQRNAEILKNNRFSVTIAQKPFLTWLKHPTTASRRQKNKIIALTNLAKAGYSLIRQKGPRAFIQKCRQYVSLKIG